MEEFKDPFQYMKMIAPEASKFGICKIIPPESWNPGFAIDTEVRSLPATHTPDSIYPSALTSHLSAQPC